MVRYEKIEGNPDRVLILVNGEPLCTVPTGTSWDAINELVKELS